MHYIKAVATKLTDNSQYPEVVQCEFVDCFGEKHIFIEKWPVISKKDFVNFFPQECFVGCILVQRKEYSCVVNTNKPWDIESVTGQSQFEIPIGLLFEK